MIQARIRCRDCSSAGSGKRLAKVLATSVTLQLINLGNLGFVLDGFPETYSQASDALFADSGDAVMAPGRLRVDPPHSLVQLCRVEAAIILDVDADKLHARRAGSEAHPPRGRCR